MPYPWRNLPSNAVIFDAPPAMARAASEVGPIFRRRLRDGTDLVYLVGPEANRLVLYTHRDHFSHQEGWTPVLGPYFGTGLLNMDGAEWAEQRRMMNPAFSAAFMATYLPVMRRVIASRTADWLARGEVDLYTESRQITFDVAAATLVGLETGAEVDRLRDLFYGLLHPATTSSGRARRTSGNAGAGGAGPPYAPPALDREAPPAGRGWSTRGRAGDAAAARDDAGRGLSDDQLLAHVNILLVAGHETSTTLASWLLYLLALHRPYLARVRSELEALLPPGAGEVPGTGEVTLEALRRMRVLHNAMTEAGRLHSPVRQAPRGVLKAFDFAGFHVPAGTQVCYAIAAGTGSLRSSATRSGSIPTASRTSGRRTSATPSLWSRSAVAPASASASTWPRWR